MAIDIEIRKNNQIVTLTSPGKSPILSRNSSFNFYNPLELLCVAVGACFGQEFLNLCRFENKNPEEFESIVVSMENFDITITIQHPENISVEFLNSIKILSRSCQVAKQLKNDINIVFIKNETPIEILTDQSKKGHCCGG